MLCILIGMKITTMKLSPGTTTKIKVGWFKYIEVKAMTELEATFENHMNKAFSDIATDVSKKFMGLDGIVGDYGFEVDKDKSEIKDAKS